MGDAMRWRVVGLHRETGVPMDFEVESETEQGARDEAYRRACVVERVTLVPRTAAVDPDDEEALAEKADRMIADRGIKAPPARVMRWRIGRWRVRDEIAEPVYVVEAPVMTSQNVVAIAMAVGLGVGCIAPLFALVGWLIFGAFVVGLFSNRGSG